MRVVAGKYRGRTLVAPEGYDVRPTTTRIKETLFNVLQGYVAGAVALDLFAGSGALGIECLSRGADEVTFVDKSPVSVACVKQNLRGMQGNFNVILCDAMAYLARAKDAGKQFDLIFLDPPYRSDVAQKAIDFIVRENLLSNEGVIVYEHGSDRSYSMPYEHFKCTLKRMGTVSAEFIKRKSVALVTGSFDPITIGHEQVIRVACGDYDEVVVACLVNPEKRYAFTSSERLSFVKAVADEFENARAIYSERMACEVAKEVGAFEIVRGVRDASDEAYEKEMAAFNAERGVATRFIELDRFRDVSSSKAKEEMEKGNFDLIPFCVRELVKDAFAKKK